MVHVAIDIVRARELLIGEDVLHTTAVLGGGVADPADILADPATTRLLDFTGYVGVLPISVLPCVPDRDPPADRGAQLRHAQAPGSHIALARVHLAHASAQKRQRVVDDVAAYTDDRNSRTGASTIPSTTTTRPPMRLRGCGRTALTPHRCPLSSTTVEERPTPMHSATTRAEFRKSRASAPQQSCVYVSRKDGRTQIWDDKLAAPDMADTDEVPAAQCLIFTDADFDAFQDIIRRSDTQAAGCLTITADENRVYIFTATNPSTQPNPDLRLMFDASEFAAFIAGIHDRNFDLTAFSTAAFL